MVKSQGLLRSELLKTDGSIDVNHVDVNGDSDEIDVNRIQQPREPIPMGFGYVPQMVQVGQGKVPGLPPGVPGGPQVGAPPPMPNPQGNVGFRPNGPMRMPNGMPYRNGPPMGGMPPNGMPPNGMPPNARPPMNGQIPAQQQPQRRAYSLNTWLSRPRITHKNNKIGNDEEEVIMQGSEDDVTFTDIRTMGKGEKYGFEADTAPIIPTLITKSHSNMNNTEYRKAMTAQKKHAMNVMARQRKTGQGGPAPGPGADPRAMSLQGYGRGSPFNPMGPGGPVGYPGAGAGPGFGVRPAAPRSMSMMTTRSRPPMGYMRQHQQNMFSARENEAPPYGNTRLSTPVGPSPNAGASAPIPGSPAAPPQRNLKLATNSPVPQTLDPTPTLNNQSLPATSPASPPIGGGQLNVLRLSQPQQNELKEREKQLADRENELKEKEEMMKKREAEVQEELKKKEQILERERLGKDQEELQKHEQRKLFEPSEEKENQQPVKSKNGQDKPFQNRLSQLQALSRCNTEEGLDLEPSSTLERGLDTLSMNEKFELGSIADDNDKENERQRKIQNNGSPSKYNQRGSTAGFGNIKNNRASTSTFMSTLSDSPQKKNGQSTGLYQLENNGHKEFFTAEEFIGGDANNSRGNLDTSNTSSSNNNTTSTSHSDIKQLDSNTPKGENSGSEANKKRLSEILSTPSKENQDNTIDLTTSGSVNSNDDTFDFDFKHANNDKTSSATSVPSNKSVHESSVQQAIEPNPESAAKKEEGEEEETKQKDARAERFSFDNTMGQPYEPMFAHQSELTPSSDNKFKTITISSEQLNILKENKSLMSEISIISAEFADSIKREFMLEEKLVGTPPSTTNSDKSLQRESRFEYENQLRSKSEKIVDLIKQLNEERLKRLVAEEQLLLSENGAKPSSADLVHKIIDLESQLRAKQCEVDQLRQYELH